MHSWLNKPLIAALLLSSAIAHHMFSAPTVPVAVGYKAVKEMSDQARIEEANQLILDFLDASKQTATNQHLTVTAFTSRMIDLLKGIRGFEQLCTDLEAVRKELRNPKSYGSGVAGFILTRANLVSATESKAMDIASKLIKYAHLFSPATQAHIEGKVKTEGVKKIILTIADRIEQCPVVRKVLKLQ